MNKVTSAKIYNPSYRKNNQGYYPSRRYIHFHLIFTSIDTMVEILVAIITIRTKDTNTKGSISDMAKDINSTMSKDKRRGTKILITTAKMRGPKMKNPPKNTKPLNSTPKITLLIKTAVDLRRKRSRASEIQTRKTQVRINSTRSPTRIWMMRLIFMMTGTSKRKII